MTLKKGVSKLATSVAMLLSATIIAPDIQALNLPVKSINGKYYYYYTVEKKDKFYELPEELGVKRSEILKYNPQAVDGIKAGMVLTFPVELDAQIKNGFYTIEYKAGDESTPGVAKKFNIPVERLVEFNPFANTGVKGKTLIIPLCQASAESISDQSKAESEKELVTPPAPDYSLAEGERNLGTPVREEFPQQAARQTEQDAEATMRGTTNNSDSGEATAGLNEQADTLRVVVCLPFGISNGGNRNSQSKASELVADFYRGFVLGLEDQARSGKPLKISVVDTYANNDTLTKGLGREVANGKINLIVGGENADQIGTMAGVNSNTQVFNLFATRDDSYVSRRNVIQSNIPHGLMYELAIDNFMSKYDNMVPVIVRRNEGNTDKNEFVETLIKRFEANNKPYKTLTFNNFLSRDEIESLVETLGEDASGIVFVPVSGNRAEFQKIAPAIKNFKNRSGMSVSIFGYPEWITFKGDSRQHLHDLQATIYTRYFLDEKSPATQTFENEYRAKYGDLPTANAFPNQGVYGYDTARFIVRALEESPENDISVSTLPYDGVQCGFRFVKLPEAQGLVNENLYFVTFYPEGLITKSAL